MSKASKSMKASGEKNSEPSIMKLTPIRKKNSNGFVTMKPGIWNVMWCESCDSAKKRGLSFPIGIHESIGCTSYGKSLLPRHIGKGNAKNFIDLLVLYSVKIMPLIYMLQQFDYHHDFTK